MGALDVCPFIPVQDVSVEECVEISKKFGQKMAEELGVPVFLYGYASEKEYRKTMPQVSRHSLKNRYSQPKKDTTIALPYRLEYNPGVLFFVLGF